MNTAQAIQSNVAGAAGFDLDTLDGNTLNEVRHQVVFTEDIDGNAISGVYIVGKNSAQYISATDAMRHKNIKKASKRKNAIDTSTDEGAASVARTIAENEHALAVAVTVDWFGFNKGGQPAPFDKEIIARAYDKMPTWQNKVNAALEVDANFMKV